jgi:hypothetical protein
MKMSACGRRKRISGVRDDDPRLDAHHPAKIGHLRRAECELPTGMNEKRATMFRGPGSVLYRLDPVDDQPGPRLADRERAHLALALYRFRPLDDLALGCGGDPRPVLVALWPVVHNNGLVLAQFLGFVHSLFCLVLSHVNLLSIQSGERQVYDGALVDLHPLDHAVQHAAGLGGWSKRYRVHNSIVLQSITIVKRQIGQYRIDAIA